MELGKKIKQLRKFSGMTQEQLAEKLIYPVRRYQNGRMAAVCRMLKV